MESVPTGWIVEPLSAVSDRVTVGIASAATYAYRSAGIPMFRNQNIKFGGLDDSDLLYLDPTYEQTYRNKRLRGGDLITARTGYPGVTSVVPRKYEGAQSFTTLITRPTPSKVDSNFLCYFINSQFGQAFVEQSQIGGAQKNFNAGSLRQMPIWLPNLDEQRAITAVLGANDALIATIERLIAKKREIKKGMMQQLLTGRTRLAGFSGEWQTTTFGEIASPVRDRVDPLLVSGRVVELEHIVPGSGILLGDADVRSSVSLKTRFMPGDVLFGKLRAYLRKFWLADRDGYCSTEVWALRPRLAEATGPFVRFLVELDSFIEAASTAYGTHMPRSDWGVVSKYEVRLPPIREQEAIAALLADANREIDALNRRLSSALAIRQGMMQELLTGRTRLVSEGVAE